MGYCRFWPSLYWELLWWGGWAALGPSWYLGTDRCVLPSAPAVPAVNLAQPKSCHANPVVPCWHKQELCDSPVSPALCCHLGNPSVTAVKEQWESLLSANPYENPLLGCWKVICKHKSALNRNKVTPNVLSEPQKQRVTFPSIWATALLKKAPNSGSSKNKPLLLNDIYPAALQPCNLK